MFGLDGERPVPCSPRASNLADAMIEFMDAKKRLDFAKASAPAYTGQYSAQDFCAPELEAYYRAADALAAAVDAKTP